jgi:hypothetical protein
MRAHSQQNCCRSCSGELDVVDADRARATVTVQCPNCGDCYVVAPDALRDGCLTYGVGFVAVQLPQPTPRRRPR